jgi:hypothetical protein
VAGGPCAAGRAFEPSGGLQNSLIQSGISLHGASQKLAQFFCLRRNLLPADGLFEGRILAQMGFLQPQGTRVVNSKRPIPGIRVSPCFRLLSSGFLRFHPFITEVCPIFQLTPKHKSRKLQAVTR